MKTEPSIPQETDQLSYALLKSAQRKFGLARLQLGVLLEHIKTTEAWKGRAASFGAFLEEERFNDSAAYQYMRVARKMFFELQMTEKEFEEIATCNMEVLDLACQVIDHENKDEVLSILAVLSKRDARQVLLEMVDALNLDPKKPQKSREVNRVLRMFKNLPDDQRIEFLTSFAKKRTIPITSEPVPA